MRLIDRGNCQLGFTMVELIVVILLLGIVSVVALPRFIDPQSYRDLLLKDQLISFTRFAQQAALTRFNQQVTLELSRPGDWLFEVKVDGSSYRQQAVERGNGALTLSSPSSITVNSATPLVIRFDNLGNAVELNGGSLSANLSFDASGRSFCISRAGYAYEAASQAACVAN